MVDQAIVQPLTEYICLAGDPNIESRVRFVAQVFHALADGLRTLRQFYKDLSLSESPIHDRLFPYPRSYRNVDGSFTEFSYICRLQPHAQWRALFEVKTKDGRTLVVKFPRTYNSEAHLLLAARGLAPSLHYSGPLDGGIMMVVMDRVCGKSAQLENTGRLSEPVTNDLEEALKLLHESDLVFGDLRLPNIIVLDPKNSDGRSAMLVDFDWCRPDGKGTYPASLNDNDDMPWHEGVKRGSIMLKGHDCYLLDKLRYVAP